MPDQIAFPALALIAGGLIALALVWPQGQGAPSPAPFGHPLRAVETAVGAAHGSPTAAHGSQGADAASALKGPSHRTARP